MFFFLFVYLTPFNAKAVSQQQVKLSETMYVYNTDGPRGRKAAEGGYEINALQHVQHNARIVSIPRCRTWLTLDQ